MIAHISIHRCYKLYRDEAMQGAWRRVFSGVSGRGYAGSWI
jgi:hypothetical protein